MVLYNPRVFISYSWTSDAYQSRVVALAERLVRDGVDVVIDVWDLRPGQDKYAFTERCVTDTTIGKVLVMCDAQYARKANARSGGVGDETAVITSEVYGRSNQDRFVPVLMERDADGSPLLPAYLKSRMFVDLSGSYPEERYDQLLATIRGRSPWSKPVLGPSTWPSESEGEGHGQTSSIGSVSQQTLTVTELEEINTINAYLIEQRENHPSFVLMNGQADQELLPKAPPIPNIERHACIDSGTSVPLAKVFRDSWRMKNKLHLYITGRGGVGKTVALLTFATEKDFLPRDVPAVYIPLYDLSQYHEARRDCIDEYLRNTFTANEYQTIDKLSRRPWRGGPHLILLLDGHNEVPIEKKSAVDEGIRKWAARGGTQVVTTSRISGLTGVANINHVKLQGLRKEEVETYLSHHMVACPPRGNNLWTVLETPLMLRLYLDVETFRNCMSVPYVSLADSDNAGHLVWNYLQREIWRVIELNKGDFTKAEYAAALLLTLPYVCWRMEAAGEFKVQKGTFENYVTEACKFWMSRDRPPRFKSTEMLLHSRLKPVRLDSSTDSQPAVLDDFICTQLAILSDETGLLNWNNGGYSLLHQNLRDGLTAVHLMNVMEAPYVEFPEEYTVFISEYVKDFLANVCEETLLIGLWEANRMAHHTDAVAIHNLLGIIHRKLDGDLTELEWGGMDLRGESLFPYRKGRRLLLSSSPSSFIGTKFVSECFRPQCHADSVSSVCFSPDGRFLASGSEDGTIRLLDVNTGCQVFEIRKVGTVRTVCFSPDGRYLASGSDASEVIIWNASSGRCMSKLRGHQGAIESVCFAPDGRLLASGSDDCSVRLWDISTSRQLEELEGRRGWVTSVCFSPDGLLLAGGSDDGLIRLWDSETHKLVNVLQGHPGWVRAVSFSPDGKVLASGSGDRTVRLWETSSGRPMLVIDGHNNCVRAVGFSPDGRLIASGSDDGTVCLWDTSSGALLRKLQGYQGTIESVCFSPDGSLLATGAEDRSIVFWDTAIWSRVLEIGGRHGSTGLTSFSPNGSLLLERTDDGTLFLWDTTTNKLVHTLKGQQSEAGFVDFSPNSSLLINVSDDGAVSMWNTLTGKLLLTLGSQQGRIICADFSSDNELLACGSSDGSVRLWSASSCCQVSRLDTERLWESITESMCLSPDGKLLACGSSDGVILLCEVDTGEPVRTLRGHNGFVRCSCFSPDGSLLASGSADRTIRLWDVSSGVQVMVLKGLYDNVGIIHFSPDGNLLAVGSDDGVIALWDVVTGKLQIADCQERPNWFSFFTVTVKQRDDNTPANDTIEHNMIIGSASGTLRVWNLDTDTVSNELIGCAAGTISACFSSTESLLISGMQNGDIHVAKVTMDSDGTIQVANRTCLPRRHQGRVTSLCATSDARLLVSGDDKGTVVLWALSMDVHVSGRVIRKMGGFNGSVRAIHLSHNRGFIACRFDDGAVRVWDRNTWQQTMGPEVKATYESVTSVCFSSDGKIVASGHEDGTVRLWEVTSGRQVLKLKEQLKPVEAVCFSPDGKIVASGHADGIVVLWEVSSGNWLTKLRGKTSGFKDIWFTADGRLLASGVYPEVWMWDTDRLLSGNASLYASNAVTFEPLHDISLHGLDFSQAAIDSTRDKEILRYAGAVV